MTVKLKVTTFKHGCGSASALCGFGSRFLSWCGMRVRIHIFLSAVGTKYKKIPLEQWCEAGAGLFGWSWSRWKYAGSGPLPVNQHFLQINLFNKLWQLLYLKSNIAILIQIQRKNSYVKKSEIILLSFSKLHFLLELVFKTFFYPEPVNIGPAPQNCVVRMNFRW